MVNNLDYIKMFIKYNGQFQTIDGAHGRILDRLNLGDNDVSRFLIGNAVINQFKRMGRLTDVTVVVALCLSLLHRETLNFINYSDKIEKAPMEGSQTFIAITEGNSDHYLSLVPARQWNTTAVGYEINVIEYDVIEPSIKKARVNHNKSSLNLFLVPYIDEI